MTIGEHHDLTERLATMADAPAPPTGFDSAWAVRQGRARLRRRQRATVGVVAVATAAVLTATLMLEPGGAASAPPAAPAAPPAVSATTAAPTRSGGALLTTEVRFGVLPDWVDGEHGVGYSSDRELVGAAAPTVGKVSAAEPGLAGRRIDLTLYPAGVEPTLVDSPAQKQEKAPAPLVDGRTAYWVVNPTHPTFDDSQRILRWLTPSGRWAQLGGMFGAAGIPDDVLLRVAAGVEFGRRDVPLPIRLTGLPDGLRPTGASLIRPAGPLPWAATVSLAVDGKEFEAVVAPEGELRYSMPRKECRTEQGLQICVSTHVDALPAAERFGGLAGLARLVGVTGADPGTWTTDATH